MRLGLMVTTDRLLPQVVGIARAAAERGHEVEIFATDAGTRLLASAEVAALGALPGVSVVYCESSAERQGVVPGSLPARIRAGSLLQSSILAAEADRIIVL